MIRTDDTRLAAGAVSPQAHPGESASISGAQHFSLAELVWLGAVCIAVGVLAAVPTLAQLTFGPTDRVHVGTFWNYWDFTQHLAAMREGASSGSWLVHNHFSPEPHQPVLMYALYVAIGKFAESLNISVVDVYGGIELGMRLALPVSIYAFTSAFIADVPGRRLALVLALFAGGLGLWANLAVATLGLTRGPSGEQSAFPLLFSAPHEGLALVATLMALTAYAAACEGSRRAVFAVAVSIAAVALLVPFGLPVLVSAFAAYASLRSFRQRRVAWLPVGTAVLSGAAAVPFLVYNFLVFNLDPFWSRTYGSQLNITLTSPPWELPIDYGVPLLLAIAGVVSLWRVATGRQQILLTWLAVGACWMYLPVPYQHRFSFGLQSGVAVLAAIGWPWIVDRARKAGGARLDGVIRRALIYSLVIFGFATPLWIYASIVSSAATNHPMAVYIVDRDTYGLGEWLAMNTGPDDVVAASFNSGNAFAGLLPGRVVLGHDVATLGAREKGRAIRALYRGDLSPDAARLFLSQNRVTHLVVGPEERKLGPADPAELLGLTPVREMGAAKVYGVPR